MEYRELGLLSILISWAAFAFLLTKWRGKKSMSISLHAASARSAYYFFAAALVLSGSMLVVFMYQWFIPHLQLDLGFQFIFFITMICFYAAILIPETKPLLKRLHRFFAFTGAALLFINIGYILTTCSLSFITQATGGMILAYMAFCIVIFIRHRKSLDHFIMRNYLRFQVMYILGFHVFILVAAYFG
jgi:hypothetical protein